MLQFGFIRSSVLQSLVHVNISDLCVVGIIPVTRRGFLMA